MSAQRMPVVFFAHGSPTNVLEDNDATRGWSGIGAAIEHRYGRPKAVLCVSAHWCTRGTAVTAMPRPRTIHDFGRTLPAPLFEIQYPAPGDPSLAARVKDLLAPLPVSLDTSWGLDHGTWAVLAKVYPEADMPIVQLSLDVSKPESWHYEMGQRLRPLRDEGVLIAGSGNIVHNLAVMQWSDTAEPYEWATRFNERVKDCIVRNDPHSLFDYRLLDHEAVLSVPTPDHYWPLLYVLGARHDTDQVTFDPDFIQYKSLSMTSVVLETAA